MTPEEEGQELTVTLTRRQSLILGTCLKWGFDESPLGPLMVDEFEGIRMQFLEAYKEQMPEVYAQAEQDAMEQQLSDILGGSVYFGDEDPELH
jgi:hypothetical protein